MIIKRDYYLDQLISSQHNGLIKIVTGLRRSGKSYLLFHLFNDYLKEQGIHDDHIIKVDLEDRRNAPLRDPDALVAHIDSKMVNIPLEVPYSAESNELATTIVGEEVRDWLPRQLHLSP